MPALAFSLNSTKPKVATTPQVGQKRKKNLFDEEVSDGEDYPRESAGTDSSNFGGSKASVARRNKSPKLGVTSSKIGTKSQNYTNLSALHSARKHTDEANDVDASVYDYDTVYDTFHAPKEKSSSGSKGSGPKYITNLLQSAEIRKRDQLRAQERLVQREREAEGDEFADKEKFVTGAYKKHQEELRRKEEEEAKRDAEEEERRRRGGGLSGFYKDLLRKDEERSQKITKAAEEAAAMPKDARTTVDEVETELTDDKIAAELNEKGAHIIVNDDGEVVDKRQLLSAGLNTGKKKKDNASHAGEDDASNPRRKEFPRPPIASTSARSQRENQSRMLAAHLEELAELAEQQATDEDEEY